MRPNYRIKEVTHYHGKYYVLERRFLGFLWWYNPDNFNGIITGIYDTRLEAEEAYKRKMYKRKVKITYMEKSDG